MLRKFRNRRRYHDPERASYSAQLDFQTSDPNPWYFLGGASAGASLGLIPTWWSASTGLGILGGMYMAGNTAEGNVRSLGRGIAFGSGLSLFGRILLSIHNFFQPKSEEKKKTTSGRKIPLFHKSGVVGRAEPVTVGQELVPPDLQGSQDNIIRAIVGGVAGTVAGYLVAGSTKLLAQRRWSITGAGAFLGTVLGYTWKYAGTSSFGRLIQGAVAFAVPPVLLYSLIRHQYTINQYLGAAERSARDLVGGKTMPSPERIEAKMFAPIGELTQVLYLGYPWQATFTFTPESRQRLATKLVNDAIKPYGLTLGENDGSSNPHLWDKAVTYYVEDKARLVDKGQQHALMT